MLGENFYFLEPEQRLARLGALAERYVRDDPPAALVKLRQFAERLAKDVAARHGALPDARETFDEALASVLLERIRARRAAAPKARRGRRNKETANA